MAIVVHSPEPENLLNKMRKAADMCLVPSWSTDGNGDFVYATQPSADMAWFCPSVVSGMLIFTLLKQESATSPKLLCSVYHGRFIEMLLMHFYSEFSNIAITKE